MFHCGILECLERLYSSHSNSVHKMSLQILSNVFWVASNLSGGCTIHANKMAMSDLCARVFQLIKHKKDKKLTSEMITFIGNIAKLGGPEALVRLIKLKVVWLICELLTTFIDPDIIKKTLALLQIILEKYDNKFHIIEELKEYNILSKLEIYNLEITSYSYLAEMILKYISSHSMEDS
jgi:hypothetical protein